MVVLKSGDFAIGTSDVIQIRNKYYGILIRTLTGHTKSVRSLAVLNNGDLASGSDDKTVKIWNPNHGTMLRTLHGHSDAVTALVVLPNDQLVTSSPSQPTIKIWNPNDGRLLQTFDDQRWNQSLTALPAGVLGRKPSAGVQIWTTDGAKSACSFESEHRDAWVCALMPLGQLAIGTFRGSIQVFALEDNVYQLARTLSGHTGTVTSLAALNISHLASGSVDKTLRIWNVDGHLVRVLVGHSARIHLLAVMNNGDLISCSDNKKLKIWRKI